MTRHESLSGQSPVPLNLVGLDWESRMENDVAFQDCLFRLGCKKTSAVPSSDRYYDYESTANPYFSVTLAANCRFGKVYEGQTAQSAPLIVSKSEPLFKIARTMTDDLGPGIQISDEFKFTFQECSPMSCAECRASYNFFAKKNYLVRKLRQPCISVTKVFDGKSVFNRFHSQMVEMFPHSFVAILHLKINVRYGYNGSDNQRLYRIGGTVTGILAMNEAKLDSVKSVDLGDVSAFEPEDDEPENRNVFPNKKLCRGQAPEAKGNDGQLDIFDLVEQVSEPNETDAQFDVFGSAERKPKENGLAVFGSIEPKSGPNNARRDVFESADGFATGETPDAFETIFCSTESVSAGNVDVR